MIHVHVDFVGPLPPSQGFTRLITVVDRFTRWPEAIPVSDASALSLARALLHNWVSRGGTPEHITSDRVSQFMYNIWSQLYILLGTELLLTTSYHPQANGMVELFHREGKKGRKEIFIWQSIHKLVVFTNTTISSLEDHTKTAMRPLS